MSKPEVPEYEDSSLTNYLIWNKIYETDFGKEIFPYLRELVLTSSNKSQTGNALLESLENISDETFLSMFGKDLHKYWKQALALMESKGIDTYNIPATSSEAFELFLYSTCDDNGNLNYVSIANKWDKDKPILDQSQSTINNMLFDFLQARLEDPDTFAERVTPGGPKTLKANLHKMMFVNYALMEAEKTGKNEWLREDGTPIQTVEELEALAEKYKDFAPDYDCTDPSTLAHYQTYNALYDKLIGIAANQNANQRPVALTDKFEMNEAIRIGAMQADSEEGPSGRDLKERWINNIDTMALNTEFLSSAVDGVKSALLEFYGLDENNFNVACLLSKIGASPLDIGLFFNQPVVKEAMNLIHESNHSMNISTALDQALKAMYFNNSDEEYSAARKAAEGKYLTAKSLEKQTTSDNLVSYLAISNSSAQNNTNNYNILVEGQIAVAMVMKKLVEPSSELSDEINISKATSVSSVQSQLGNIEAQEMKVDNMALKLNSKSSSFTIEVNGKDKNTPIIEQGGQLFSDKATAIKLLEELLDTPYGMERAAYSSEISFCHKVLAKLFPYYSEGYTTVKSHLASLTQRGYLSADTINAINKELSLYFMFHMIPELQENQTTKVTILDKDNDSGKITPREIDTEITPRIFYMGMFPAYFKKVMAFNQEAVARNKNVVDYSKIPLLAAFHVEVSNFYKNNAEFADFAETVKFDGIGALKKYQKDIMLESLNAMASSQDPILRELAEHFWKYGLYSRGFNFGDTSILGLTPSYMKHILFGGEYARFFNREFNIGNGYNGTLVEHTLDGNINHGMTIKGALKAFILNHTKDYCFCKTANNNNVKSIATLMGFSGSMTIEDMLKDDKSSSFTINPNEDKDGLFRSFYTKIVDPLSSDQVTYKYIPCIKIGNAYYICDSNINDSSNAEFNVSTGSITYYRMDAPFSMDYSEPALYGTRERYIQENIKDKSVAATLLNSLNSMSNLISDLEEAGPKEQDINNIPGGDQIQSEEINSKLKNISSSILSLLSSELDDIGPGKSRLKADFREYLMEAINPIIKELQDIATSNSIEEMITKIDNILDSEEFKNPMNKYIKDIESWLRQPLVIFDFETSCKKGTLDSANPNTCGIAQIGAIVISDGQVVPNTSINSFVELQRDHEVPAKFNNGQDNPIYAPYYTAVKNGELLSEQDMLQSLAKLFYKYPYAIGYNNMAFDKAIFERRCNNLNVVCRATLQMDVNSMAYYGLKTWLPYKFNVKNGEKINYKRETITEFLKKAPLMEGEEMSFQEELSSLLTQLNSVGGSHDALNDVIETYCIMKHIVPYMKQSSVIQESPEYQSIKNGLLSLRATLQDNLNIAKAKKDMLKVDKNLNEQANKAYDENSANVCK